jgi:TP901 family phage tail tape measure protein
MAASYTRRINLYINSKVISNDLVSIRKEMSKLVNEQARMTMGSKEYVRHASEIKKLKRIIDQHNNDLSTTAQKWNMWQRMADASNRYFAVITAGIAAVTGVVMVIKSTVTAFAEYDDKLVDVMKTTDLTKQETIALSAELKKIDTRTAQVDLLALARVAGKLGFRGKEDILGFVKATDMIRVALSEDLGGDTEESVRQLGKLVEIFKLTKEFSIEESLLKIGSAMNALGASGTANEGFMLEFSKRVAGVAPTAGISIDKILGLATTLDELGQTSEVSSTAFNQVISKMFKDTAKFADIAGMSVKDFTELMNKDANEAMIQLLIGAKGSANGFGELTNSLSDLGMDGVRATTVLGALAANIDLLRENQKFSNEEFVKGTDLLVEFNKKNNSAQAILEKHTKTFKAMQVELGEKLTPIYSAAIHKASTLLKVFGATVEFLFKYGSALVTVGVLIATYTVLTQALTFWETRKNEQVGLGLVLAKLQTFWYNAQFAAVALYTAGVQLLSGNLKAAAVSMRAFSAALSATPLGWVMIGITAVIGAIRAYDAYSKDATEREYAKAKALKDLNIITEGYAGNLENLNKTIQTANTLTLQQKILAAEAAEELILQAENALRLQLIEQESIRTMNTKATLWQKTVNMFKSAGNIYGGWQSLNTQDAINNGLDAAGEMTEGINTLKSTMIQTKETAKQFFDILNAESQGDKIGSESLVMMNEKLAKYRTALDNAIFGGVDYLRIQQKIADVQAKIATSPKPDNSDPDDDSDDLIKAHKKLDRLNQIKLDTLTAGFNKEQALIRQNYLQGLMTEDEYNHQMLLTELKFLKDKLSIYKVGDEEYQEAVNKSLELQVTVDNKLRDLQLKAEQELANAKIDNFRDEFIRQEEAEKQRWADEKTALELRLIDKVTLNEKEQAINDAIHALIEEKEKTHQQKIRDLKTGQKISELEERVTAATPFDTESAELSEMQRMFDAKKALIEEQYKQEKDLAAGNQAFLLGAEKRHNDALIQLKLDLIDAEWNLKEQKIAAGQAFIGALSGMVDQETALGKALFAFNQGLAIAEIWVSLAKANAKAIEIPGGAVMIPFNTAIATAQTALVLAQTVKAFTKPSGKSTDKGFSDGGHTGPGGVNEPAGIVHKKEYVVPANMLADPQVRYIVDMLERMRTRKVSLSQAAIPLLSSGGFSSLNRNSASPISLPGDNSELIKQQNEANLNLANAINMFLLYRPTVAVETIEREREKYIHIKQTKGL